MSPREYSDAWAKFNQDFGWYEIVGMARKAGLEADEAYIWGVLGRIRPGETTQWFDAVGLSKDLMDSWYTNKGDVTKFSELDRKELIQGARKLGALLASPPDMIQRDYDSVRSRYAQLVDGPFLGPDGKLPDILEKKLEHFWSLLDSDIGDPGAASRFARANLDVQAYLDNRENVMLTDPQLRRYYAPVSWVEKSFRREMYVRAEAIYGPEIFNIQAAFFKVKDLGGDTRSFMAQHPELDEYWYWLRQQKETIRKEVEEFGKNYPQAPGSGIRPGAEEDSIATRQIIENMNDVLPPINSEADLIAEPYLQTAQISATGEFDRSIGENIDIEAEKRWPGVIAKDRHFDQLAATNPMAAATYLASNRDLQEFRVWEKAIRKQYNQVQKLTGPPTAAQPVGMTWPQWTQVLDPTGTGSMPRLAVDYFRSGTLSETAETYLKQYWIAAGKPEGSLEKWLKVMKESWKASGSQY